MGILRPCPSVMPKLIFEARRIFRIEWHKKEKPLKIEPFDRFLSCIVHINKITFYINCFRFVYFRVVGVFILSQNENPRK